MHVRGDAEMNNGLDGYRVILFSPYCEEKYKMQNISLNYIMYYLKDHGIKCEIYDLSEFDENYNCLDGLIGECADVKVIIGITGYTRERFHAYRLIKRVRSVVPHATIVVGGHHFGYLAKETLTSLDEVDIVVRGEGEITFYELCQEIINDGDYKSVLGISYREKNKEGADANIIENDQAPLERNLDKFRSWDKDDFRGVFNDQLQPTKTDPGNKYFSVMATRGCPSNCNFCSLVTDIVRFRSVKDVLDEIEEKINITGCRNVTFADSSLTINKNYVRELCDGIIERKLNIRWNCYSRIDMNQDLLAYMKKAGLVSVEIALESGSPRVLKSIGKGTSLSKYMEFVKNAYDLEVKVWCFLILSSTDEEYEDALMTIDLMKKSSDYVYDFGLQVTRILPDTALDSIARERGALAQDFDWFADYKNEMEHFFKTDNYQTLPIYIEKMSIEQIQDVLSQFEEIKEKYFVYPDELKRIIMNNLSIRRIKKYRLKDYLRKIRKFIVMLANINNASGKVGHFTSGSVDASLLKRPEWDNGRSGRIFNIEKKYSRK